MTKIDIFSGFLGAGKTTLIKKLIKEAYAGEKLVLIENEFGEIGIDGGFLQEAGIQINEMNSGCICCSLVGDFGKALHKVLEEMAPDRILIEPSGVGKLSDVVRAVQSAETAGASLGCLTTVADATKCKMYMKNFGEFYNNQIEHATTIILSRTDHMSQDKLDACVALIREKNPEAVLITTPWDQLDGKQIHAAMEQEDTLEDALKRLAEEQEEDTCPVCGGHHDHDHECDHDHEHEHHHDHDHECDHDHEHHHDHDHECDHDHEHEHHHDHDHECDHDHEHEHHHDHDHECGHDHEHHHHHADEVFTSWGQETTRTYTREEVEQALAALSDEQRFGMILRAKGILPAQDGSWIHFDYVPGESDVRTGPASVIGRLCVIGSKIHEEELRSLFHLA